MTRQDVASQVREARELSSDASSFPSFSPREISQGNPDSTCGHQFIMRLGLNDVGLVVFVCICTSSTAQGGGGSFENRKPIGKVGCCESRMAERSH